MRFGPVISGMALAWGTAAAQPCCEIWNSRNIGISRTLNGVFFSDAMARERYAIFVGDSGSISKAANYGNPVPVPSPVDLPLYGVHFPAPSVGYAVGGDPASPQPSGFVLQSRDGGQIWERQGGVPAGIPVLYAVHFPDSVTGFAVGGRIRDVGTSNGVILRTRDGGQSWSSMAAPFPLRAVHFPTPDTGYAVGLGGTILKSVNRGAAWSAQNSGTTRALHAVFFPTALIGYGVGDSGTILKTVDGGDHWTPQTSGTIRNLNSVHAPRRSTAWAYIVGDSGTALITNNSGAAWYRHPIWPEEKRNLRAVYVEMPGSYGSAVGENGAVLWLLHGDPVLKPRIDGFPITFDPGLGIRYRLERRERVRIRLLDSRGRSKQAVLDAVQVAGLHVLPWPRPSTPHFLDFKLGEQRAIMPLPFR